MRAVAASGIVGDGESDATSAEVSQGPHWLGARKFGVFSAIASGVLTLVAAAWWTVDEYATFAALGWAAAFVVSLPFLRCSSSLHSPWSLVVASVYIGCAIRGTFISFQFEGPGASLDTLFLLGKPPEYFVGPSVLHLAGVVFLTAGYVAISADRGASTWARPRRPDRSLGRSTPIVVLVLAAVGFVAFVLYVRATGGFDAAALSAKRTTINGINLSDDYTSHGALRFLNGFATAAFWVAVAYVRKLKRRGDHVALSGPLILALGVNAVLLPFYASSRSDAAFIILVAGAIHFAFGGRFSRGAFTIGVFVLVALLSVMTVLRSASGDNGTTSAVGAVLESFVYNRNFGDMQNTSHIVRNVPDAVPYQDGATMAGYMVAPVPRAIWPEKPIVNAGPQIGIYIYGNSRSGVPPGIFGDFYLNFGPGAVVIGSVLSGAVLGGVERWRRRLRLNRPTALLAYCTVGFRLGLFAMNKGLAFAIFKGAMELVPVLIALALTVGATPSVRRRIGSRPRSR